ncbi:hypothetical protein NQ318_020315 [Aromia moschata]|uniref:Tyrosinase copper-binding domain-containing protein n=1 Tax=Aromia moschata TaxID=1265417 RepID=A0AAV8ZC37_9CUCU|nr:hypothetical protein NQ318_020315 [Aromia moschata]
MAGNKKHLLLLFDRPQEPCFMEKGPQRTVTPDYATDIPQIVSKFSSNAQETVSVNAVSTPSLGDILELKREENFSLFIPKHRKIAGRLIDIFLGVRNVDELLSVAIYARERVNPYLFNYSYSVALLHRPDTQDLDIPSIARYFPDKYVDSQVFSQARAVANIVPEESRTWKKKHRVAYFREDIGINLHHWHWHLVYPFEAARSVVDKNRRGELFYYMHEQIMARYNFERFSNNLKRVERFIDWDNPIKEAYFPKLDSLVASRSWPPRVANQRWQNLRREVDQIQVDIDDMKRWRDRIVDAIHAGVAKDANNRDVPLTENEGIDILGNMVESSILSPNRAFYGDLHNMGHVVTSYVHDPDHRHLESFGVIGDSTTAMRDPFFYRWHAYVDDIFQKFKETLPRYTVARLDYPGVTITDVQIQTEGGQKNVFQTFWQQSDMDLSRGMDFQPRGSVFVRFTHLQHSPFTYTINVNNEGKANRMGTCRIFLAPKFDEKGTPWMFRDQKNMFIELDKFRVTMKSGRNVITRRSTQSSVTIPFERTYRDLDTNRPQGGDQLAQFNFCGCGWPHNMLIPKGTAEGLQCELFVMISNYDDDRINQTIEGQCNDADSYCGIKDKLYPDRRSMGYPFDRMPRDGVQTLQQFLTRNMRVADVTIRFTNRTLRPKSGN